MATPIGNLEDLSQRALRVLQMVDQVLVEDTRHSRHLLQHFNISRPLLAFHDYSEDQRKTRVLRSLLQGKNIALISDAGTPLISDPGYALVSMARKAGVTVTPIPGACALIAALSASGMATDRFCFEGFLSAKGEQRRRQLLNLAGESRTLIFYESRHRLVATVGDMISEFGARRSAVLAKELTKRFETFVDGALSDIQQWLLADDRRCKGEFVILVAGADKLGNQELNARDKALLRTLRQVLDLKTAAATAAKISGRRKNLFYRYGLSQEP